MKGSLRISSLICTSAYKLACSTLCRSEFYAPCRTNKYPREIPELPWYRSAVPQMVMAGQSNHTALYFIRTEKKGKVYVIRHHDMSLGTQKQP